MDIYPSPNSASDRMALGGSVNPGDWHNVPEQRQGPK